jgi:peptidyl-prolyl cis-trans isomerase SurA
MTRVEFESALVRANISPNSLLDVMRAQAIWQELLRLRARNSNVSNAEINAEVDQRMRRGEGAVTDYVLRQVIFVVNAGNPAGARERDAAAARGRVQDCDASVDYLRTLREVAVRERIARTSTEISKQLNDMLQKTAQGRMTPTFRTDQGVEALIVCEKRERQDIGALRATVERELSSRRVEGSANSYLSELKQRVEIVRR